LKDCGTVVNIRWVNDRDTGRFKGFGFVTMGSAEEAQKAVNLPNKDLGGRQATISPSGDKPVRNNDNRNNNNNPRGGASPGKTCFKCGKEGHMSRECPDMNKGGGSGGDCFKCGKPGHMSRDCTEGGNQRGAKTCFKCGQSGHFSKDCGGGNGAKPARLFITKVSDAVTDDMVKDLVKSCGTVADIQWASDKATGRFKGFGFITMGSEAECQKVVDLPNKVLAGKEVVITLSNK